MKLPDVELPSTLGGTVNPSKLKGRAVIFCYPYTGRPGVPDPEGWDAIPGAHGSTPQAKGYAALHLEFAARGISIYGLSFQGIAWQKEFAERCAIPFPLLSDADRKFSSALDLQTFWAGDREFLKRVTLIVEDSEALLYEPGSPELDASVALKGPPYPRTAPAAARKPAVPAPGVPKGRGRFRP